MEENIKEDRTSEATKPSYSAPTLGINNSSSSTVEVSSKESLNDISSKQKNQRNEKSHKDFPEIRAYYAK